MGRKKSKTGNKHVVGYSDKCIAIRNKTNDDMEVVKEIMRCLFGRTKVISKDGGTELDHFYASGETLDAKLIVHITGPKKDVVNIMFKHGIESVGFKIKEKK